MKKNQMNAVSSVRGLLILVIAIHNTLSIIPIFQSLHGTAFIRLFGGILGNTMFFMISGFLIGMTYRKRIQSGNITFQGFLLRRLQKLYPLYLISNAVSLIIQVIMYGGSAVNLKRVAFTVLLQSGGGLDSANPYNAPTWFLSTLFVCYVAFYFISEFCKTPRAYIGALIGGVAFGYTLCSCLHLEIPFCFEGSGIGYMNFFLGCLLAELYPVLASKKNPWRTPLAACAFLLSVYLPLRYGVEIICGSVSTAFAFVICPLILYLSLAAGPVCGILQWKPLVALGKLSMHIFYWHLPLFFAFNLLSQAVYPIEAMGEKLYCLYFVGMLACSALSYRMTEKIASGKKVLPGETTGLPTKQR